MHLRLVLLAGLCLLAFAAPPPLAATSDPPPGAVLGVVRATPR